MIAPLAVIILAAAQVQLRAGEEPPAPEVIAAGPEGVLVGRDSKAEFLIGWDRVRRLDGPLGPGAGAYMPQGEALWRARTRLERGDAPGAEPIFEQLMPALAGQAGPMPAVAAEGLLRCRLRRGAQVAAIEPWLIWLQNRDGGQAQAGIARFAADWAEMAGLDPIMDRATGLIPALPPIWLDWPAVRVLGTSSRAPTEATLTDAATALSALYQHAAGFEAGIDRPLPPIGTGDAGVAIVADIVTARTGTEAERASARDRLAQRIAGGGEPWMEAWCRAALGRSMIREIDAETRCQGVIQLLHLPARFGGSHRYLAGLCLAEASVVLAELGYDAGAARLRQELLESYPDHPVLEWSGVRLTRPSGIGARPAQPSGPGAVSLTTENPSP
jgi:hypothetical protein